MNIPGKVKAQEVDLQAVMKAGKWSSEAPLHPSILETSVRKLTGPSRRSDRGDLLLGGLSYC